MATVDRATSCQALVDVECKRYEFCQKHRFLDGEEYKDFAYCRSAQGLAFPRCQQTVANARPQHERVSAAAFNECISGARGEPRTRQACAIAFDERNAPSACFQFLAEVHAQDYVPEKGPPCAPNYTLVGEACLLACQSDADCRPKYEKCGDDAHPQVCVARSRQEVFNLEHPCAPGYTPVGDGTCVPTTK